MAENKTKTVLDNELRAVWLERLIAVMVEAGEEVLRVAGGEVAIPVIDGAGNDSWVTLSVKVPKGNRLPDGAGYAGYDGYAEADSYAITQSEKQKKATEAAALKAKKIADANAKKAGKKPETETAPEVTEDDTTDTDTAEESE